MPKDYWRYADAHEYLEALQEGMPPAIICVACNGALQGKEYNPAIPETADEIADSVYEAYVAGASMVHVHARDPERITDPAYRTETWWEVNKKIRERCPDIIINNTTGGGPNLAMEDKLACLDARPEMASLNLVPDMGRIRLRARKPPLPHPREEQEYDRCTAYTYGIISHFAAEMKRRGIKPELETYHTGGPWVIEHLIGEGLLEKPYWIQTVMGYQTSSFATVDHVLGLLRDLPDDTLWLCAGVGRHQLPMTTLAAIMGGHLRVGLEDNIYYARGRKAASNAELVERAVRIVHELNREVATPAEARRMLNLPEQPSSYT